MTHLSARRGAYMYSQEMQMREREYRELTERVATRTVAKRAKNRILNGLAGGERLTNYIYAVY